MKISNLNSTIPFTKSAARELTYMQRQVSAAACMVFFKESSKLPLSKNLKHRTTKLAEFNKRKGKAARGARRLFGKNLIHYGINLERTGTIGKKASPKVLSKVAQKSKIAAKKTKLLKAPRPNEEKGEGLCFAASMHCIKQYFKLKENGVESAKAFSDATDTYKNGMPEKIAVLQTLEANIGQGLDQRHPDYRQNKLAANDKLFANIFRFRMGAPHKKPKSSFSRFFLDQAHSGTYLISLMDDEWKKGHTLVIIKNKDKSIYIYDPNFGAAIIPKKDVGATLRHLLSSYHELNNVYFSRAHPQ